MLTRTVFSVISLCLAVPADGAENTAFYRTYQGLIDGRIAVTAQLERHNDHLTGSYYYHSIGEPLRLEGTIKDTGEFKISEFDKKNVATGFFFGHTDRNQISGKWLSSDRKKSFSFIFHETPPQKTSYGDIYRPALNLLSKAEAGDRDAQFRVAILFHFGQGGFQYDIKRALYWYLNAAQTDDRRAQYAVGYLYFRGHGFVANISKAREWMQKSAAQGHVVARHWLDEMDRDFLGKPYFDFMLKAEQERKKDTAYYVNLIEYAPLDASKGLKSLSTPTAKAYLAYLYFTGWGNTKDRKSTVNKLMSDAITAIEDDSGLGEIDKSEEYSYDTPELLLSHIRFISGSDNNGTPVPCHVFFRFPSEAYKSFNAYWGGNRDNFPETCYYNGSDIFSSDVSDFLVRVININIESQENIGTIRFSADLATSMDKTFLAIAPQILLNKELPYRNEKTYRPGVVTGLDAIYNWSLEDEDRHALFAEIDSSYKKAIKALENQYYEFFLLKKNIAEYLSKNNIDLILHRQFAYVINPQIAN